MTKVNIQDVAKGAKVSAMTVVRALNGSGPVAPKTRQRILAEAQRLNYFPNALVKGVKGQRTKTVGLVFNAATPETTADNINLMVHELQRHEHLPYIMSLVPREEDLKRCLRAYLCQRVDGVVIWSDYPPFPYSAEIADLLAHFHASVFVTAAKLEYASDQVVRSPFPAIREVADHFVRTGRRTPAFFGALPVNQTKADCFLDRLRQHGLKPGPDNCIDSEEDPATEKSFFDEEFPQLLARRFGKRFPFDALLVTCDEGAAACMHYLRECGLRIPQDVAVVGYNNYAVSKLFTPPLASIELNFRQATVASAELLFRRLADRDLPQQVTELPLSFVWRESAGAKPAGQPE